jgi:3-keto-disaccharide hydrolase
MKRITTAALMAALALGAAPQEQKVEEGYASLFNGKDLTGWKYGQRGNGEHKDGAGYQVENGVLFSTVKDGGNLYTEKEYADFSFRFEFKLTANANNGIAIRAPGTGDAAYVGMEIQVLDDSGSSYQKLQPYQYHGSIYDLVACKRGSQKPVGEWNEQEIQAKGRQIKVTLNGTVIVDANLDDIKDEAKLKKHPGAARAKGFIGFLGHGARVEFRNLRIKEL